MDNLKSKTPNDILDKLGKRIETYRENGDLENLRASIEQGYKLLEDVSFENREKAVLNYFIGNAWSYVQRLKYPDEEFPLETPELEKQIICLRIANNLIEGSNDDLFKCQILTNLGNLFSHIGRFSEAQDFFNRCIKINKNFGMAIGNRGFGLFYYARVIFDPSQQFIFMQHARKDLLNAVKSSQVYFEAKYAFLV